MRGHALFCSVSRCVDALEHPQTSLRKHSCQSKGEHLQILDLHELSIQLNEVDCLLILCGVDSNVEGTFGLANSPGLI